MRPYPFQDSERFDYRAPAALCVEVKRRSDGPLSWGFYAPLSQARRSTSGTVHALLLLARTEGGRWPRADNLDNEGPSPETRYLRCLTEAYYAPLGGAPTGASGWTGGSCRGSYTLEELSEPHSIRRHLWGCTDLAADGITPAMLGRPDRVRLLYWHM